MITREANKEDLAEITVLAKQFKINSKDEDITKVFSEIIDRKDHIIVVCVDEDGKIAGYIHGLIRLIIGNPMAVEIGGIIIQKEYRRTGLGSLLLFRIEDWSKQNRISTITLASTIQNTYAHNFYNINGYVIYRDRYHFIKEI